MTSHNALWPAWYKIRKLYVYLVVIVDIGPRYRVVTKDGDSSLVSLGMLVSRMLIETTGMMMSLSFPGKMLRPGIPTSHLPSTLLTSLLHSLPNNAPMWVVKSRSTLTFWSTILVEYLSIWMSFHDQRHDVSRKNYEIADKFSHVNVATFECSDICTNWRQ